MSKTTVFSEMSSPQGVRAPFATYQSWFEAQGSETLFRKAREAEAFFRKTGITFNVYGQADAEERLIPFDLVPRIISAAEWDHLSAGITQRVLAANAFLHDLYNGQEIIKAGIIPQQLIAENDAFLPIIRAHRRK